MLKLIFFKKKKKGLKVRLSFFETVLFIILNKVESKIRILDMIKVLIKINVRNLWLEMIIENIIECYEER